MYSRTELSPLATPDELVATTIVRDARDPLRQRPDPPTPSRSGPIDRDTIFILFLPFSFLPAPLCCCCCCCCSCSPLPLLPLPLRRYYRTTPPSAGPMKEIHFRRVRGAAALVQIRLRVTSLMIGARARVISVRPDTSILGYDRRCIPRYDTRQRAYAVPTRCYYLKNGRSLAGAAFPQFSYHANSSRRRENSTISA